MKKIIITILSVIGCFTLSFLQSCKSDPCDITACAFSGVCDKGLCKCQIGYEGTHCETVMRDKFLGIWTVNEDGSLSPQAQYVTSIEAGNNINEVKIYNVQNSLPFKTETVLGIVKNDTITLPLQTKSDGSTIQGWGFIKGTNPLNQHYYQHALVTFYYEIVNKQGLKNIYGTTEGAPSIWSK